MRISPLARPDRDRASQAIEWLFAFPFYRPVRLVRTSRAMTPGVRRPDAGPATVQFLIVGPHDDFRRQIADLNVGGRAKNPGGSLHQQVFSVTAHPRNDNRQATLFKLTHSSFASLEVRADNGYEMDVLTRSPVVALAAIGAFLACQMICPSARGKERSLFSSDPAGAEYSGGDSCCGGTKQAPEDSPGGFDCCLTCCCSGAILAPSVMLDRLDVAIHLSPPWSIPNGDLEIAHAAPSLLVSPRPPEPSLRTIVLLI